MQILIPFCISVCSNDARSLGTTFRSSFFHRKKNKREANIRCTCSKINRSTSGSFFMSRKKKKSAARVSGLTGNGKTCFRFFEIPILRHVFGLFMIQAISGTIKSGSWKKTFPLLFYFLLFRFQKSIFALKQVNKPSCS